MQWSLWNAAVAKAMCSKLGEAIDRFAANNLERIDVGVFPWHGSIELSFLFAEDDCDPSDVAAWKHYNFSNLQEGKWPEADQPAAEMRLSWEEDVTSSKLFFENVALIMSSESVKDLLARFKKSEHFEVTLFDPDNRRSKNYCA